jgi:hypothetical protein
MFRIITGFAALAAALALAGAAAADWNSDHLPSPAPGYLPKTTTVDTAAWNAAHLPSPAPGYLPQTVRTRIAFVRVPAPRGFVYRDAAIGAALGALFVAVLGGTVLVAVRARRETRVVTS